MNLILLFEDDFVESGLVEIKGRRLDHVKQVIRTKVGEDLTVGIENGKIEKGKVTTVVQVTTDFVDVKTKEREVKLLIEQPENFNCESFQRQNRRRKFGLFGFDSGAENSGFGYEQAGCAGRTKERFLFVC